MYKLIILLLLSAVNSELFYPDDVNVLDKHFNGDALANSALDYDLVSKVVESLPTIEKNANSFDYETLLSDGSILGDSSVKSSFDTLVANNRINLLKFTTAVYNIKTLLSASITKVDILRNSAVTSSVGPATHNKKCCSLSKNDDEIFYNSFYNTYVSTTLSCTLGHCALGRALSGSPNCNQAMLGDEFLETCRANAGKDGSAWQYFGSQVGVLTTFPAHLKESCVDEYDPRLRPWYLNALTHKSLDVVIIMDKSGSMNKNNRIVMARKAITSLIKSLRPRDRMAFAAFSNIGPHETFTDRSCQQTSLSFCTTRNVKNLATFVENLDVFGGTYYAAGLGYAKDYFMNSDVVDDEEPGSREKVLVFVSDGQPEDSDSDIMTSLRDLSDAVPGLIVMTYGLDYDGDILNDMATHNYAKFNVAATGNYVQGEYQNLTPDSIKVKMGQFYMHPSIKATTAPVQFSMPYLDAMGLGMVITASKAVINNDILYGVVGFDITMDYLLSPLEDLIAENLYHFMLDATTGSLVYHPEIDAPKGDIIDPIHYTVYETDVEMKAKIQSMIDGSSNNEEFSYTKTVTFKLSNGMRVHGGNSDMNFGNIVTETTADVNCLKLTVTGTDSGYIICMVDMHSLGPTKELNAAQFNQDNANSPSRFRYHKDRNFIELCNHGYRKSNKQLTSVKFSPRQWREPAGYLATGQDSYDDIAKVDDILKGKRPDTLFKDFQDVKATAEYVGQFSSSWTQKDQTLTDLYGSSYKAVLNIDSDFPITVWRYYGTNTGTFRIHPAVQMPQAYDPSLRPWYKLAATDPSLTFITPPYEDASGLGYVVTITKAVRLNGGVVGGVFGTDYFLTQLGSLIQNSFSGCDSQNTCIMIDSVGTVIWWNHLVMNPHLIKPYRINANDETVRENLMVDKLILGSQQISQILINKFNVATVKCHDVNEQLTRKTLAMASIDTLFEGKSCHKADGTDVQLCKMKGTNSYLIVSDQASSFAAEENTKSKNCPSYRTMKTEKERNVTGKVMCNTGIMGQFEFLHQDENVEYNSCFHSFNKFDGQSNTSPKPEIPACQGSPLAPDLSDFMGQFDRVTGFTELAWSIDGDSCFNWMKPFFNYILFKDGRHDNFHPGSSVFSKIFMFLVAGGLLFGLYKYLVVIGYFDEEEE